MASKLKTSYFPEFSAFIFGRTKPSMVTVNITNQCNQNCIYCEIGQEHFPPGKESLTYDDMVWILDEMAKIKIRKISLCGGEPFLFKGIIDLVAYAGRKNIRCSITTNGMTSYLLSDSDLNILKEYKTEINISIDSFQEEIQTITRGTPSALSNALKSLQKGMEYGISVTVLTVISKYNYQDLFNNFTKAYEKGVKQMLFQPVIYYSNYPEKETLQNKSQLNVDVEGVDLLMEELKKILRFEKKHKINTNVYRIFPWISHYIQRSEDQEKKWFFNDILNKFFCREVFAIIDISYDGGIQPCGFTKSFISIRENRHKGLKVLWTEATDEIRKDLLKGNFYLYCNACCNHFSRNMLASILKYPIKNRKIFIKMVPFFLNRIYWRLIKKIFNKH